MSLELPRGMKDEDQVQRFMEGVLRLNISMEKI